METPRTILDELVSRFPHASKTTLRQMVENRRVVLNGLPVKSVKQALEPRDKLAVRDTPAPPAAGAKPQMLDEGLKLVYQDGDVLVVNKPSGLLTATDEEERRATVLSILAEYIRRSNHRHKALLVHRLDRGASGLLVFARTDKAFHSLKEQFYKHTVTRQYDVIVHGVPRQKEARLEHILQEDAKTGEVRVTRHARLGRHAALSYVMVGRSKDGTAAHLRCTLETGRKHQIRVQLKAIGNPVIGDDLYGDDYDRSAGGPLGRLALHASVLAFEHPRSREAVRLDATMPREFLRLL